METNKLTQTPSQTVGPFFSYCLTPDQGGYSLKPVANANLLRGDTPGEHITLKGRVFDGNGDVIHDALIEIWQADGEGNYISRSTLPTEDVFVGFGRCDCETDGGFLFQTVKPGSVEGQAPHINMIVLMRGMLSHAFTRIYFSDETDANANDTTLRSIPENRRNTIIATRNESNERIEYLFDLHMQGVNETVFFDV